MTHRPTTLLAAAALAAGLALAPVTAHAETTARLDPADAGGSLQDVLRVALRHGPEQVVVKVRFLDLRRTSEAGPSGLAVFLDADPDRPGPERRFDTGLQSGTDYQLTRTRGWAQTGGRLTCDHGLRLDWDSDVATVRVSTACLGRPDQVRVAVKMVDQYDASHPVVDWLGEPRSFTPYVTAG